MAETAAATTSGALASTWTQCASLGRNHSASIISKMATSWCSVWLKASGNDLSTSVVAG
jgi:hypothetical protein